MLTPYSSAEISAYPTDHDDAQAYGRRDLERLVHLAESLTDRCERYRTRSQWLFHYATGLGGAVLTAAGLVWAFMDPDSPLRPALTGAILGTASGVASVSVVYYLHLKRRWNKDTKALEEVTTLLRGPAGDPTNYQDLTLLDRATFHIRLGRLDVHGPKAGLPRRLFDGFLGWLRGRSAR